MPDKDDVVADDDEDVAGDAGDVAEDEEGLDLDSDEPLGPIGPVGLEPPVLELPTTPLVAGRLAFYDGEMDEAIKQFSQVLADKAYDEDSRAKALYWMAEARLQQDYTRASISYFDEVVRTYPEHSLGGAAANRSSELKAHFDAIDDVEDA